MKALDRRSSFQFVGQEKNREREKERERERERQRERERERERKKRVRKLRETVQSKKKNSIRYGKKIKLTQLNAFRKMSNWPISHTIILYPIGVELQLRL